MADRFAYATLTDLKAQLGITDTTDDSLLLQKLETASQYLNGPFGCNRHFFIKAATRTFTAEFSDKLLLPVDLLSITTLKTDEDDDWDYDNTWTTSDYHLHPFNSVPKRKIMVKSKGAFAFTSQEEGVQIIGQWGYGDGATTTPYTDAGTDTAEVLDATETGVDVGSGTAFEVGQTILVESEQMFISAIASNTLTVVRAVNGTTAATHVTSTDIYIYQYPAEIVDACILVATKLYKLKDAPFGILGQGESGNVFAGRLMDPRIVELLSAYRGIPVA